MFRNGSRTCRAVAPEETASSFLFKIILYCLQALARRLCVLLNELNLTLDWCPILAPLILEPRAPLRRLLLTLTLSLTRRGTRGAFAGHRGRRSVRALPCPYRKRCSLKAEKERTAWRRVPMSVHISFSPREAIGSAHLHFSAKSFSKQVLQTIDCFAPPSTSTWGCPRRGLLQLWIVTQNIQ